MSQVIAIRFWFALLAVCLVASAARADSPSDIAAHLDAGEFGPARQVAEQLPRDQRDRWLGKIATAQSGAGARKAALWTAYGIDNDRQRAETFRGLSAQPVGASGGRGGAALADFDSLIELITSTIRPDSWEDLGGTGAIESFPTGVYVDSAGVMKRVVVDATGGLEAVRKDAADSAVNRDVQEPSALRKVSLTRLERHAQLRWANGRRPTPAMQTLAGIYQVRYILFYPESRDIVLAGPAGPSTRDPQGRLVNRDTGRPVLLLDDLVVMLRNALEGDGTFGCAITPRKERLAELQQFLSASSQQPLRASARRRWLADLRSRLGNQDISVFGIDNRTRAARVLVEADYHMKLIGMGLEEGTVGVPSYLDTVTLDENGQLPPMEVLRWWFTQNYEAVRTTERRDAYELVGPGVKVLSENEMLTERGERVHTGKSGTLNQQFAHNFTRHFEPLSDKYPVYADLRNLFDLAVVAAVIGGERLQQRVRWELAHFGESGAYQVPLAAAPREVESVIHHRTIGRKHLVVGVSGGVRVDTRQIVAKRMQLDTYGALRAARASQTPAAIPLEQWWWD